MQANKKADTLSMRDAEDLEEFSGHFHSLSLRAFGMEPSGSPTYETPSIPGWLDSFGSKSSSAMARAIWSRLTEATELYAPTFTVLMALHSPTAVQLDGVTALSSEEAAKCMRDPTFRVRDRLDVGRRLAVYPCTWAADEAREWRRTVDWRVAVERMARGLAIVSGAKGIPGPKPGMPLDRVVDLFTLNGRQPGEVLRDIAHAKRAAKGNEADLWREIDTEASLLILGATRAWNTAAPHRAKREKRWTDVLVSRAAPGPLDHLEAVGL